MDALQSLAREGQSPLSALVIAHPQLATSSGLFVWRQIVDLFFFRDPDRNDYTQTSDSPFLKEVDGLRLRLSIIDDRSQKVKPVGLSSLPHLRR
jgi:hypothetical protein